MVGVGFGWPALAGDHLLHDFYVHFVPDFYHDVWAQMWDPGPLCSKDLLAGDGGNFTGCLSVVALPLGMGYFMKFFMGVALRVVCAFAGFFGKFVRRVLPSKLLWCADEGVSAQDASSTSFGEIGDRRPRQPQPCRRALRWLWRRVCAEAVAFEAAWVGARRRSWSRHFVHKLWWKRRPSCIARALCFVYLDRLRASDFDWACFRSNSPACIWTHRWKGAFPFQHAGGHAHGGRWMGTFPFLHADGHPHGWRWRS